MIRSMYSGISGLKNFQTKLDVIGNNVANVNTYGFKKGRTVFKDLISQTTSGASGATNTRGGVNPKQIGLGSQLASIDTIHTGGSLQTTGNTLDLAISGDGFFVVGQLEQTGGGTAGATTPLDNLKYTRAGNFYMDNAGMLVDSEGRYLLGASAQAQSTPTTPLYDPASPGDYINYVDLSAPGATVPPFDPANYGVIQIPTDAQSMSVGQDGTVTFVGSDGILYYAGQLTTAKFANPGGLEKVGGNYFNPTSNSGDPFYSVGTEDGMGTINSGFLEMSNVDLSEEFTDMIVAQRGFQANTRIITTSDSILEELINLKR